MSTYPDFGDTPITREYLSSYTKFELLNFVMEILSKFYETSKALNNAKTTISELQIADEFGTLEADQLRKNLSFTAKQLDAVKAERDQLQETNETLSQQCTHDDKHIISLQIEIGELKSECNKLRAELKNASTDAGRSLSVNSDLRAELGKANAEILRMAHEYKMLVKQETTMRAIGSKAVDEVNSLRAKIEDLTKDRDGWKSELEMYSKAWGRELKLLIPKAHRIDSLVLTTRRMVEENEHNEAMLKEIQATSQAKTV